MKGLIPILTLGVLLPAAVSRAQLASPNEKGVANGHVHLLVRNVEASTKFFVDMGGTAVQGEPGSGVVEFPGVVVRLRKGEPTAGSVGSVVDHIGFNVRDLPQSMAKWKAAGLKPVPAPEGNTRAHLFTADGMKIEIIEDKSIAVPIQNHHIHFHATEANMTEMMAWYGKMFGAKPGKRLRYPAADLPGVNLSWSKDDEAIAPTKGRTLDHIGFEVKNLEAFCKNLAASGMKFDRPYIKLPTGVGLADIIDPWGTLIELNEH